ncbi:hypothetical protein [Roseateles sp. LYH14W]|uniref:Uncharacterized protein n=1 Tax=Pelomonas parva TaxID=3299032 RepID=A0ABW7FAS8_9BURK
MERGNWLAAALAAAILATASGSTFGQNGSCASVYAHAVTNVDIATRKFAEHERFFAEHCESNGSLRKHSDKTDFSIAYAGIQFGYAGSSADAEKKMQQFCKSRQEERDLNDDVSIYKKAVAVDALKSFNQCRALESGGITITPLQEAEAVIITATFDPFKMGSNVSLSSVSYDADAAKCTTNAGGSTNDLQALPLPVSADKPFQVTCARKKEASKDGTMRLKRFALLMTIRDLPYSLVMPPDELLGFDLASQNKAEIAKLTQSLNAANATIKVNETAMASNRKAIEEMRALLNKPVVRTVSFYRGTGLEVRCDRYLGESYVQQVAPTYCRADEEFLAVSGEAGTQHGTCGRTKFNVTCASKPKY